MNKMFTLIYFVIIKCAAVQSFNRNIKPLKSRIGIAYVYLHHDLYFAEIR